MHLDEDLKEKELSINIFNRVYFAETDAGGIVYYGNLCKYIEMGCAECLRKYAISMSDLAKKYNIFLVMRDANLRYIKPIVYDEEIEIVTKIKRMQYVSVQFITEILVNGELRYSAENRMVSVDLKTKKPCKMPNDFWKNLKGYN